MSDFSADFTEMYRKYAPDVLRFAFYLTGERSEAEDIASETFVRAWTSTTPITAGTVKGYLFTIAKNLYLHTRVAAARRAPLDDQLADRAPTAQRMIEYRDDLDAVTTGLALLPDVDRSAFLMRVDGLAYEEIATALGISSGSARVKIYRVRLALAGIR